ncbi:S-TKc multi-domain protein [Pyrenophora teres f. teres]|uniref:S-TKc multi-domain protein n=1 Tax=Pyrenophora teres f. teres TaxID=97479 RepID=A0A6S6W690_9PLEO|nr:S-TKc multi-domain protein [Pyrenophora teres f. teres]
MADDPASFWERVGRVFDPTPEERDFCERLPEHDREYFRLFLIGVKFGANRRRDDPDTWRRLRPQTTIRRWRELDEDTIQAAIDEGRIPDPRLDNIYFSAHRVLATFARNLRNQNENEHDRFRLFAAGWKVCHLRYEERPIADTERHIIQLWTEGHDGFFQNYITVGERMLAARRDVRTAKAQDTHYHQAGQLPSPTQSDLDFVTEVDPETEPEIDDRPVGSHWRFVKTLFQGMHHEIDGRRTQRIVHLFVLEDGERIIRKRMVVKIIGEKSVHRIRVQVGREYRTQEAVSGKGCPHILDVYGFSIRKRLRNPQLGYIFMEYAPFGTLLDLQNRVEDDPLYQVPEPFMWLIFRGLIEALYTHQTGLIAHQDQVADRNRPNDELPRMGDNPNDAEDWRSIINPDIKTANVVLGEALPYHYPAYKVPKIIDYGHAFFEDPLNPRVNPTRAIATTGWGPPEQMPRPLAIYSETPIKIYSNVYNVGQIMFSLMEGREMQTIDDGAEEIVHTAGYRKMYSSLLEWTVADCLELRAIDRPTLDRLLFLTHEGVARWEEVYGSVSGHTVPAHAEWDFEDEDFQIGGEILAHTPRMRRAEEDEDEGTTDDDSDDSDDSDDDDNGDENSEENGNDNLNNVEGEEDVIEDEGPNYVEEESDESDDANVNDDDENDLDYVFEEEEDSDDDGSDSTIHLCSKNDSSGATTHTEKEEQRENLKFSTLTRLGFVMELINIEARYLAKELNIGRLHSIYECRTQEELRICEFTTSEDRRRHWRAVITGFKLHQWKEKGTSSDDFIINQWTTCVEPEFSLYTSWGAYYFAKFESQRIPRHVPSNQYAHWFYEEEPKPGATTTDIHVVNDFDPRLPGQPRRPEGSRWVFEETLYATGDWPTDRSPQRVVHLFALISRDYEILKRIVVKMMGEEYDLVRLGEHLETEYDCHDILSATGCPHILEIYGCSLRPRLYPPHLGYLYMEYAEYGDMQDLLDHLEKNPGKQIPEPYIWLIFRGLLEAVFAMTCGTAISKNMPSDESGLGLEDRFAPGWEPFINTDIKPENIVLTRSQDGYYPGYSTAKMIDFGIALTESKFESSEIKVGGIGTLGWGPPVRTPNSCRQMEYKYDYTPIHVHSEIFNVAQVVLSLMEGQTRVVTDKERREQRMSHAPDYKTAIRPSLVYLLHWTKKGLENWEQAYGSVNKPEGEIPDIAKYKFNKNETMLKIGEVAPSHWKGLQRKRSIPEEEALQPPIMEKRPRIKQYVPPQADVPNDTPKPPPQVTGIKATLMTVANFIFPESFRSNEGSQAGPPAFNPPTPRPADRRLPSGAPKPHEQPGYLQYVAGMGRGEKRIYVQPSPASQQVLHPGPYLPPGQPVHTKYPSPPGPYYLPGHHVHPGTPSPTEYPLQPMQPFQPSDDSDEESS